MKLPIAFIAGLRLKLIDENLAQIQVKYGFFNQNPFRSMFWAVQGMAAELSTGVLCLSEIKKSKKNISMLVIQQDAEFYKKATGKITFECSQGREIMKCIHDTINSKSSQTIQLFSVGKNEQNEVVSKFSFTWSFKLREWSYELKITN
jgi:hypothetical protein